MARRGTSSRGNRTRKGSVTSKARKRYGTKSGPNRKGSFPVFDQKSAMSALRLRGHARSRSAVIAKVSRWASSHNNATVKAAVKRARAADAK
jgi:hypothetical protein